MAKIFKTIAPVDSMSGMIGSRQSNLSGKAVIANIRKKGGNWNDGNPYQYFSVLTRSTAPTQLTPEIIARRNKFAAVAASTRSRMADTSQAAQDMLNFKNQTKYKTLYSYVWNLEWNAYTA